MSSSPPVDLISNTWQEFLENIAEARKSLKNPDIVWYRGLATGHPEITRVGPDFKYRQIYWDKRPFAAIRPIAMEPPFQNDRMLAQKGMFTIHGDDRSPLDEQCPTCVRKVVITKAAMINAWEFPGYANINEFSVFPDIVGLAPYIKHIAQLE